MHQTFRKFLAKYIIDVSYSDGPLNTSVDEYRRVWSSNDSSLDTPVTLSSLVAIGLDTSILPDVFGLRAFDSREPVTRMLPGQFGNFVCVLVPDNEATHVAFHDVIWKI